MIKLKCTKCGYEQESDFERCPLCGVSVKSGTAVNTSGTVKKKKKMSKKRRKRLIKRLSVFVLIVLAIILLTVIIVNALKKPKFEYPSHSVTVFSSSDTVVNFIFDGKKTVSFDSEDTQIVKYEITQSGKYAVILTNEGQLYVVNSKECIKFDDADAVSDFRLAPFSDTVLYMKDYSSSEGGMLSYCELSKPAASKQVAQNVFTQDGLEFIASGGGKAFAYMTYNESGDMVYNIVSKGRHNEKEYRNLEIEAVSDNLKYVYYYDGQTFTVNGNEICDRADITNVFYNRNGNEALVSYNAPQGTVTKLVRNGKICEEDQVGSLKTMILPDEIVHKDRDYIYYDVDSFVKTAAGINVGGDVIYYYISNKSGRFDVLFSGKLGNGEIYIASDCKTIYFRKESQDSIKFMSLSEHLKNPKEYISKVDGKVVDAVHFKMSKDGEHIYFIDNDGALYYQKNKNSAVLIHKGCVYGNEYYVTDSGNVYFGVNHNGTSMELMFSKRSSNYSKVRVGEHTEGLFYSKTSDAVVFNVAGSYYSASSGKGKLIFGND